MAGRTTSLSPLRESVPFGASPCTAEFIEHGVGSFSTTRRLLGDEVTPWEFTQAPSLPKFSRSHHSPFLVSVATALASNHEGSHQGKQHQAGERCLQERVVLYDLKDRTFCFIADLDRGVGIGSVYDDRHRIHGVGGSGLSSGKQ